MEIVEAPTPPGNARSPRSHWTSGPASTAVKSAINPPNVLNHELEAEARVEAKGVREKGSGTSANVVTEDVVTCLVCEPDDDDGFTTVPARARRQGATDLTFFRWTPAGLSQKQRKTFDALPTIARNAFYDIADHDEREERGEPIDHIHNMHDVHTTMPAMTTMPTMTTMTTMTTMPTMLE